MLSKLFNGVKNNQEKIALAIGYIFVACLFLAVGRFTVSSRQTQVKIEEPSLDLTQIYNNLNPSPSQSVAGATTQSDSTSVCQGKIKGNPSSKIYHVPGGAFYDRLSSAICFDSERDAQAAGYRKSQR